MLEAAIIIIPAAALRSITPSSGLPVGRILQPRVTPVHAGGLLNTGPFNMFHFHAESEVMSELSIRRAAQPQHTVTIL